MKKTFIDYLRFRFKASPFDALEAVRPAFGLALLDLVELGGSEKGKDGWQQRRPIIIGGDEVIGWIDYGGESQRGWSRWDMSGEGCSWISCGGWRHLVDSLPSIGAELRRVDVALDFFDGEVVHDDVLSAYESGLFKRPNVGRSPKMRRIETSCPTDGRTIYIGARESSRFIRCYEKGWEMVAKAKVPQWVKDKADGFYFRQGVLSHPKDYYRLEVELKAVDGVVIPLSILLDSDPFFAGAAPWLETLVDAAPIRTQGPPSSFMQSQTLQSSMQHCAKSYGGLLRALLELYGDTVETKARLFDALCSQNPSDSLVRAGCLSLPVGGGAGRDPLGGCPAPDTITKELKNDLY